MEEKYPVLEGAESFYFDGNDTGVLVTHGFTGTTQSMYDFGKSFADAGYTVYGPRLNGHGTHHEDMEQTTYQDWIDSVEEGIAWLSARCSSIVIAGLSMGGTLTLYAASTHPEVKGMIVVNAIVENDELKEAFKVTEPRFLPKTGSDIKAVGVEELSYEVTPLKSVRELAHLMKETKSKLSDIHCPTLIFVSEEDHIVPPKNAEIIKKSISADQVNVIRLKNSYHVATLDLDKELIFRESVAFVKSLFS